MNRNKFTLHLILFSFILLFASNSFSETRTNTGVPAGLPTLTSFSPSGGPVGTLVTVTGTNLDNPTAFTIGSVSAIVVSNDGSTLVGMVMPGAVTGSVSVTTAGGTASSSNNFTVTPTPYPSIQQGTKLVGSGSTPNSYHGYSVAISADGNTAVVGGFGDDGDKGAAWIYTRSGGVWSQQGAKLVGTGAVGNAEQGVAVAINADGNTVLVGGKLDNVSIGAVWVFTRTGAVWSQQGSKLLPLDAMGQAEFGTVVSISADGNTAIVGGPFDDGSMGAAWIFTRSGGTWNQQGGKLLGSDPLPVFSFEFQGIAVAISGDGNTAIVGSYWDDAFKGAVWVYHRSGGVWTQEGPKLVAPDYIDDARQGCSVALSADGNTAIFGGFGDHAADGAAWVYTRSGGLWSEQAKLSAGVGNTGYAGSSVSISADGNTALLGAPEDAGSQGALWVFTRTGTTWTQRGGKIVGSASVGTPKQGQSVSLSADGKTAIVGGNQDNTNIGASWVFVPIPAPAITSFSPANGPVGTMVTVTGTDLSNLTAFTIGGVTAITLSNDGSTLKGMVMPGATSGTISVTTAGGTANSSTSFTVTSTPYPSVQQGSKLIATGNIGAAGQGSSVAVSADGNTAIVSGYTDNSDTGAVWIYTRSGGVWSQQGNKLVGTGAVGKAMQGSSVAISADGNTAVAGGYKDNGVIGAVWVFTRSGGVWSQQGTKLVGTGSVSTSSNVFQGFSVSISADGNTIITGGLNDNGNQGAAWIFTRSGGVWSQQGSKLVGTGGSSDAQQGYSVALSADGNTAMVGGYLDNGQQGAAWIFTRIGGIWSQQGGKLVGTGNTGVAYQGTSVALSADGNTAASGGFGDNNFKGAAWIFTRTAGVWSQQGGKLVGSSATTDTYQGSTLCFSADGNTLMSGGGNDNAGVGAAWVFTRSGGVWSERSKLVGSGNIGADGQGYAAALSADGGTAILGGLYDNANQGATWVFVPAPPSITSFTPDNGPHGTLVTLTGTNLDNLSSFMIGGVPAIVISNNGTTLVGMVMPGATTGNVSVTSAGGTATGSGNFSVIAPLYPTTQQGSKLVATGNVGAAGQGFSSAISADGNTAIVGGPVDDGQGGAVWIYTRTGTTWSQQGGKLVGTGATGPAVQGYAVALSADGNTAIVGGPQDLDGVVKMGAVWIFTRTAGVWTQQGPKLVGTGGVVNTTSSVLQGVAVSLSADGNTAIVGGGADNDLQGAVWIFNRNGSVWTQQGSKLVGTGGSIDARQGFSVAVSADGNTALIGGVADNGFIGAAWVFTNIGGTWTQQGSKLVGTGNIGNSLQGRSVSLSADGNTAVVGGPGDDSNKGAVWVYTRTAGVWSQQGSKLVSTGGIGSSALGTSISQSADGNTFLAGGSFDNSQEGGAWMFTRSGSTWTQLGSMLLGTGAIGAAEQGTSVSLSADANTAVLGGYADNTQEGAVWMFAPGSPVPVTFINLTGQQKGNEIQLKWSVANETGINHYEVERSATGAGFNRIGNNTVVAGNNGNASYTWTDNSPIQGVNFYRVKSIDQSGKVAYTNTIRVTINGKGSITVSPNPVTGTQLNLQFSNIPRGVYPARIINSDGHILYRTVVNHEGGSSTQALQLPYKLATGIYLVELLKPDGSKETHTIVVN